MEKLTYAVFALGDRHYEQFCKFGKDLDGKLAALGGEPAAPSRGLRRRCRRAFRAMEICPGRPTQRNARLRLSNQSSRIDSRSEASSEASETAVLAAARASFTRDNPLLASLVDKSNLTHAQSTKSTLHLAFSIEGTGLSYEAGDACGVIPRNDANLVAEILQRLRFNGNEQVPGAKSGTTTLHDALMHQLQITRLTRKMVQGYATRGNCALLLQFLQPEQKAYLDQYVYDRGLIDLLTEYPGVIDDPAELVGFGAQVNATPLLHFVQPGRPRGTDSCHGSCGPFYRTQSESRRRMLDALCRPHRSEGSASDLHSAQQEIQIAVEPRHADDHDWAGYRNRSVPRLSA